MRSPLFGSTLLASACIASAWLGASSGCGEPGEFHERADVKATPCVSCHRGAYEATANPKHLGLFPDTCSDCHTYRAWSPAVAQRHDWFPLRNKHLTTPCASCHTKGYRPGDTPKECVACHQKDYDAAKNPPHAGTFGSDCASCHTDAGWRPSTYQHAWPLEGLHATAPCLGCHTGDPPRWAGTPKDCASCHQKDYDAAKAPPHAGYPTDCAQCHTPKGWRPSSFAHGWPLQGAHARTSCFVCHTGRPPKYTGLPRDCVGCHLDDYQRSTYPGHQTFPTACATCHTVDAWKPAIGGVHPEAKFPITSGSHSGTGITCLSCHVPSRGPSTGGQNTDCINCHLGEHHLAEMNNKHQDEQGYQSAGAPPNFCLKCHPMGRKD